MCKYPSTYNFLFITVTLFNIIKTIFMEFKDFFSCTIFIINVFNINYYDMSLLSFLIFMHGLGLLYIKYIKYINPEFIINHPEIHKILKNIFTIVSWVSFFLFLYTVFILEPRLPYGSGSPGEGGGHKTPGGGPNPNKPDFSLNSHRRRGKRSTRSILREKLKRADEQKEKNGTRSFIFEQLEKEEAIKEKNRTMATIIEGVRYKTKVIPDLKKKKAKSTKKKP